MLRHALLDYLSHFRTSAKILNFVKAIVFQQLYEHTIHGMFIF